MRRTIPCSPSCQYSENAFNSFRDSRTGLPLHDGFYRDAILSCLVLLVAVCRKWKLRCRMTCS